MTKGDVWGVMERVLNLRKRGYLLRDEYEWLVKRLPAVAVKAVFIRGANQ